MAFGTGRPPVARRRQAIRSKISTRPPYAGVIRDSSGTLYGMTTLGGQGDAGVIFEVSSGGPETVLYAFAGSTDGFPNPYPSSGAPPVRDPAGNHLWAG